MGLALALGATPAVAQTRVSVAVGFGVPRPFVHGVVVVGRPFAYYPPAFVVVRRPYFYRHRRPLLFVRRVYPGRRPHRPGWDTAEHQTPWKPGAPHRLGQAYLPLFVWRPSIFRPCACLSRADQCGAPTSPGPGGLCCSCGAPTRGAAIIGTAGTTTSRRPAGTRDP